MSANRIVDIPDNTVGGALVYPAAKTTTFTSTAKDFLLGEEPLQVLLSVGTVSGTTPTLAVQLQECDTSGGSYTNMTGGLFTTVTAASARQWLSVVRTKRYVQAVCTIGGTTPSFTMGIEALSQQKDGAGTGYTYSPQS